MMLLVDTKVDVQYKDGGISMERIPNAVYTKELREEAVKMITEGGMKASEVAHILSIPKSTITYWIRAEKKGRLSGVGTSRESLSETEMELLNLKRELAQVKMERDFLKKASAYFAKESHPGTRS
jgi:transposase-like protein